MLFQRVNSLQGPSWGYDGYGKVARNQNNHCGVATNAMYPILVN